MQIIESELFTVLLPDKGYKLINKTNGVCSKKVYLGIMDSVENYGEIVDEKYINMDYVVELDDVKKEQNQNIEDIDLMLRVMDEMYTMFEPILAMVPRTMRFEDNNESVFVNFYYCLVKRGIKDIESVPELYREQVRAKL